MQITRGIIKSAQKIVIYGPEGIGKSSLAAMFPNGVFIDTEGSTKHMNVARLPNPSSWAMLMDNIAYIKANPQECGTLTVDTADWAEALCINQIISSNHKTGIEDFGYGKGYIYLEEEFGRFLNSLSDLIELGINVVLVAHAQMRKFEQPDEAGAYDRWELKLEKKTAPLVKEWADMLLFVNYKTFVVGTGPDGKTKKGQGGKRVIYTQHHACWDAKNRHGLPEELTFNSPEDGWKQIAHCIPGRAACIPGRTAEDVQPVSQRATVKQTEPEAQDLNEVDNEPVKSASQVANEIINELAKPKTEPPKNDLSGVPKALADLMCENKVTVQEIQTACANRGYVTIDTPISNYDPGFIDGCLVGAWPQVFQMICDNRK